jgi:hypothetical protein
MRYLVLVLLNLPVIMVAIVNITTQYKLKKVSFSRFRKQLLLWVFVLVVVAGSFPLYNLLTNRPAFDSSEFSLFDIVQTTAIVYLLYFVNGHRQRLDQTEKRLRDLHQELSIKLSNKQ